MANVKAIQNRINRGVKWLDSNVGRRKWSKKIDLSRLDLSDPHTCMIGEVLGSYRMMGDVDPEAYKKTEDYGFEHKAEPYALLTTLWKCILLRLGIGVNTLK